MELTNNLSEKALYDYKVVKRAITGDEQAYAELFKRYKDSVYFMILKMVNNRTDAEDLMFEAFEKAFTSLNYYSPQFAFSTWLFKIASYDYKVVKRAITGDEQAYAELFKRYKDSVYFMILKMVNNRTDAEDLMFEAFEKAFTSLNYYSPQFAFSTWLFKIASNNTIDFIRKKKAKIVSLDKDDINQDDRGYINSVPADVLNPEEETIRKQRAEFMREKVAMLKGRYRKLIELRYFEEYSYEEIAQELAIPLGTVKAQLFRARELLLNILQNSEIARENERV